MCGKCEPTTAVCHLAVVGDDHAAFGVGVLRDHGVRSPRPQDFPDFDGGPSTVPE
jgi:hypothetical protein